jgi:hypothetical protein
MSGVPSGPNALTVSGAVRLAISTIEQVPRIVTTALAGAVFANSPSCAQSIVGTLAKTGPARLSIAPRRIGFIMICASFPTDNLTIW